MQRLMPEDVPGAVLRKQNLNDNTLLELRRWLLCRGLPCGNKSDVIARYAALFLAYYFDVF